MSTDGPFHWPLTAREAELNSTELSLERGGGAILVGGPGVGKSLLLATALERAADTGRTVMSVGGASWSSGERAQGYADLDECLEAVEPATLGKGSDERPVVGIDDAHLVGSSAGQRLHRLVAAGRLTVLATSRKDASAPHGVDKLWVDRLIERVEVPPFDRTALSRVLHARLGGHTDAATLERLWGATNGNALMLRELVDHAVADESLRPVDGAWVWRGMTERPGRRLSEVVRLGLRDLGDDERELVNMLAVAEPLEIGIAEASGLAHAAESLDLQGIVAVTRSGRRTELRLAVPLSRAVIVSWMSDLTADRLRRQVADTIERTGGRRAEDVLRSVSLRIEAGMVPPREQLLLAARAALQGRDFALTEQMCLLALRGVTQNTPATRHPYGPAAGHADEGAALSRIVTHAFQHTDHLKDCVRTALLLGRALIGTGRYEEAESVLATALITRVEVPQDEYVAAQHARVLNLAWRMQRVTDADAVLDSALATVGPEGSGVLHASRAVLAVMGDRFRDAVEGGEKILRSGVTSPSVTQSLAAAVALARTELGETGRARELLGRLRESMPPRPTDETALLDALAGRCALLSGRLREASLLLDNPRRHEGPDDWLDLLQSVVARSRLLRMTGEPSRAVETLRHAVAEEDREHEWPVTRAWALAQLAGALAESGAHPEAVRTLVEARTAQDEAVSHPVADDEIAYDRALVLAHTGDLSAAAGSAVDLAERAARSGRAATAVMAYHLAARVKENAAYRFQERALRLAAGCDGALVRIMGEHIQALAAADGGALSKVSREFRDMGALPLAAEASAQAARAHGAAGQHRKGREAAAVCQELMREGPGTLPPWAVNKTLDKSGVAPLTPREREVAALAATGMSNRDIARRLVVSVRTVENHLHRIYHKLGITDRDALRRSMELSRPTVAERRATSALRRSYEPNSGATEAELRRARRPVALRLADGVA